MKQISPHILTFSACILSLPAFSKQTINQPNIIFIIADQWRGNALGFLEKEPVITPCIDQLAAEGICFTEAISNYPVSSPARAMFMTGQYPIKNKVSSNCNSEHTPYDIELSDSAYCWSDVLKEQGYDLGYIGKWHLDAPYKPYIDTYNNKETIAWNEWCPKERRHGFDFWVAYGTYDNHLNPMYWNTEASRDDFYFVDQWGPEYEADQAIKFISDKSDKYNQKKPFALVVSMNPPHTGYDLVPAKYKDLYQESDTESLCQSPLILSKGTESGDFFRKNIKDYYACISGVDEQIGRILKHLETNNLSNNTIVIFTSDHGDCMGMRGIIGKNTFYDEAMRIPMIIRWPDKIKPRTDHDLVISIADLYPTLFSLMGYKKEIPAAVESFDLSSSIISSNQNSNILQPYYQINPDNLTTGRRGLRSKQYTFVIETVDGIVKEIFLFDRKKDPYELQNLATEREDLVSFFTSQLKLWLNKTNDPFINFL